MSPVKNAVIAAAGLGSRLGLGMPKCMISINKVPILAHMLELLLERVDTIVVVVGYREELIIEYCQNNFRDVIVARNPDFATTNTAQSLALGARFVEGKTIFLDGDLLVEKKSIDRFLKLAEAVDLILGVTQLKTEQPVYVDYTSGNDEYLTVNSFSRERATPFEWANLFVGPSDVMDGAQHYVFDELAKKLPAKAALIEVEEIDTPLDIERAEASVRGWMR